VIPMWYGNRNQGTGNPTTQAGFVTMSARFSSMRCNLPRLALARDFAQQHAGSHTAEVPRPNPAKSRFRLPHPTVTDQGCPSTQAARGLQWRGSHVHARGFSPDH